MTDNEFAPQPILHDPNCPSAKGGQFVKGRDLRPDYSWAFTHACVGNQRTSGLVAVPRTFEPHPYQGSQIWPANASRELCATCRGTHPGELSTSGSHIGKWYGTSTPNTEPIRTKRRK